MWQNNYDNKLVGRWEIWINDVWHNIINYYPSSQSLLNNSYKTKIKLWQREASSQNFFALRKRPGFNSVKLYEWNQAEDDVIEQTDHNDWEFTDTVILDWYKYAFATTKDKSKMRIYKQIWVHQNTCGNVSTKDINTWYWINITKYEYEYNWTTYTKDHFPFGKCIYDKFVIADWVKWKQIDDWWCVLKTEVVWNELVHSFVSDWSISSSSWDYVFIYDWTYAWQVADVLQNNWSTWIVWWWRAGMYNVWMPEVENVMWSWVDVIDIITKVKWSTEQTSTDHKYKIFKSYWPIINFATLDGIFHLHYNEGKPSTSVFTYNYFTHSVTNDWEIEPIKAITWFNHFDSNINFLENRKWIISSWLIWYNKFYFTSFNSKELGNDYTHIVNFQAYMILLWPSHTAVFKNVYRWDGVMDFAFFELSSKKWYFSKDSFDSDWSMLAIFTNTNKAYVLQLEYVWAITSESDLSVWFTFNPVWSYQFSEYVWERQNLDPDYEDVNLNYEDWEMRICVSPKYKDNNCVGTKIYLSDLQMKFWYQWIINWEKINWYSSWMWYGESIYYLEWDKDNWKYYPTVAWMFFWEQTLFSPKKIDYARLAIWSDSYITNWNTKRLIDLYMEDRNKKFVYDQLWTTSYVQYIMKSKDHGEWDVMFDLPIDMQVEWGNGVWIDNSKSPTIHNLISEFFDYNPESHWDSNIPNTINVNKYWILEAWIWMICSNIYTELITQWSDSIELLWMFVSSDYIELFASKPDNTVVIKDRSFSWPSNKTLTNGFTWK